MPTIVSYNADSNLVMPTESANFPVHLGEVDGKHYLSVPDGFTIPAEQAPEVGYTVYSTALDPTLVKRLPAIREINAACLACASATTNRRPASPSPCNLACLAAASAWTTVVSACLRALANSASPVFSEILICT